jgi:DUF971 family protein
VIGVIFNEGGTGAMAGDYTEGPFSENVLIENNRFLQTATVNRGPGQVSNRAALEMMGCTPVGSCGFSGNSPLPSSAPDPLVERRGGIIRTAEMGTFVGDTAATLRTLKYLGDSALEGVQMGVYGSHGLGCPDTQAGCPHPTNLIVSVDASSFAPDGHGWQQAHFNQTLVLSNGTFWLAHWYTTGQVWRTVHATGVTSWGTMAAPDGLLPQVSQFWDNWSAQASVPLAAEWVAEGDWCDVGGTLPPPIVRHVGDKNGGRITEPGAYLQGHQVYHNVTVTGNRFVGPTTPTLEDANSLSMSNAHGSGEYVWSEYFISLGAIDGLTLSSNRMVTPAGLERAGADIVLYSNTNAEVAEDNVCFLGPLAVPCNASSNPIAQHDDGGALKTSGGWR